MLIQTPAVANSPHSTSPCDTLADIAALAVLRLTALPKCPDAQPEADRGGEVTGHAEPGGTRVDGFAGDQVQLGAETTRRRGGCLGERVADRREGQAAGERDDRQGLDLKTRENAACEWRSGKKCGEFSRCLLLQSREPPLERKSAAGRCEWSWLNR